MCRLLVFHSQESHSEAGTETSEELAVVSFNLLKGTVKELPLRFSLLAATTASMENAESEDRQDLKGADASNRAY